MSWTGCSVACQTLDAKPNPVLFYGLTASGGAFSLTWIKPMAGGKTISFVDAEIRRAYAAVAAERILPLQQRIDRLRKDVDRLMRERGSPPEQVAKSKTETAGRS